MNLTLVQTNLSIYCFVEIFFVAACVFTFDPTTLILVTCHFVHLLFVPASIFIFLLPIIILMAFVVIIDIINESYLMFLVALLFVLIMVSMFDFFFLSLSFACDTFLDLLTGLDFSSIIFSDLFSQRTFFDQMIEKILRVYRIFLCINEHALRAREALVPSIEVTFSKPSC